MADEQLLPCPFCGGRASLVDVGGTRAVECDECCASIHEDPEYAIAAWNRRTIDRCATDAVMRLGIVPAKDDEAMLIARKMIEDHIECYGMVPHPDRIKDRIAGALQIAFEQGRALAPLRDIEF